jgi:nitroreductase
MLGWRLCGVSLSWPWCAIMPGVPLTPDELLTTTRSVRKRLDLTRPVPLDLVKECLEMALQAPNGGMREGWHWIVVTDPQVRAQIGDFYRRSAEPYLARAAAADPSRDAGSGVMARVSSSSAYLARHMGQVPVLVIPCITVRPAWPAGETQAGLWGSLLPAAWSYMLAAGPGDWGPPGPRCTCTTRPTSPRCSASPATSARAC